jgi:hypothetical protein
MKLPLSRNDNCLTHAFLSHGSIRILCDREQMRLELAPPPSTVGLNNFRSIESNALKRIDSNENNSAVSINAMLSVTIANRMKDYLQLMAVGCAKGTAHVPDGSFRWESVAKSSAVSRSGGFRKGGRPSLPSLISFPEVLMVIS